MDSRIHKKIKEAITAVVPFDANDEDLDSMAQAVVIDNCGTPLEVSESLDFYKDLFTEEEFIEVCYKVAEVL